MFVITQARSTCTVCSLQHPWCFGSQLGKRTYTTTGSRLYWIALHAIKETDRRDSYYVANSLHLPETARFSPVITELPPPQSYIASWLLLYSYFRASAASAWAQYLLLSREYLKTRTTPLSSDASKHTLGDGFRGNCEASIKWSYSVKTPCPIHIFFRGKLSYKSTTVHFTFSRRVSISSLSSSIKREFVHFHMF